jgi:hypothetical protein
MVVATAPRPTVMTPNLPLGSSIENCELGTSSIPSSFFS